MRIIAAVVAVMAVAASARAQERAAPAEEAWGTSWTTHTTVGAYTFVGAMTEVGDGRRRCAAGGACRAAVDDVPGAVSMWNLEIEGCDASPTVEGVARLWACGPAPGPGTCTVIHETKTGIANAPGCVRFRGDIQPQITVNNLNFTYFVDVFGSDGVSVVPFDFRAVRVNWLRQVRPAPATATFSDVPTTHPYFQFVEALADSRISAGCGGGQFCPDRPLTRGEMAVFLSVALGLNFPD